MLECEAHGGPLYGSSDINLCMNQIMLYYNKKLHHFYDIDTKDVFEFINDQGSGFHVVKHSASICHKVDIILYNPIFN